MQCGLCAVVAGFFRRAMCIAGSRRGSGESCYQELATEAAQGQQPRHSRFEHRDRREPTAKTTTTPTTTTTTIPPNETPLPVALLVEAETEEDAEKSCSVERRSAEVTVDSEEQNAVFVRISEDAALASSGIPASLPECEDDIRTEGARRLSETDRILLESLDVSQCRTRHTARFLTMHKRRRKRLATRSLNQEQGILDDIFHGLVQCVLQKAGNWRFNAFTLETVTGGRSLPVLCVHLFHWYGLLRHFNLDVVTVWKLFAFIEEGYHSTNPYHNSIHATDVTQAMHCFLQEEKIRAHLTNLEIMASLIAAVTHDLDHPGVNQPFLVATSNHLAALYQNTSVLENHHWRSAIGCLLESGVSDQLPPEVRPELQRHISSLILATDITRQQEFLNRFKHYLDESLLDMKCPEDRHFILQIALKCADISNPCRPWDISRKWSYKVCEEFFRQGDYERQLNLPVTPLCDRRTTSIPKIQAGFFKFVVAPLYEEWHRFLGDGLSVSLMRHLRANQKKWEALIIQEAAQETETEISELEEVEDNVSSGEEVAPDEDSGSVDLLIPNAARSQTARRTSLPGKIGLERASRRHSVPMSIAKPLALFVRNGDRRESLPNEHTRKNPSSRLDDQSLLDPGSISLLSSRSSMLESSMNASTSERPVSAENLLPDTSIASITNSAEASRLSTVLQPDGPKTPQSSQTKQLTRQQTFPPLQPYARMRYMSTTAEMSQCYTQILMETETSSNSSSVSPGKERSCSGGHCGTPPRAFDADSPWREKSNGATPKRSSVTKEFLGIEWTEKRRGKDRFLSEQRVDSSVTGVYPRRHSMQTIRQEDPSTAKHRYKRPSSAQETSEDSARTFYESLIGARADEVSNVYGSDRDVSLEKKRSSSKTIDGSGGDGAGAGAGAGAGSNGDGGGCSSGGGGGGGGGDGASSKRSDRGGTVDSSYPAKSRYVESELRRHSTPVNECRTATSDCGPRRFTAIPVSSELSTHKVFFIGSPPDSPPRIQSGSSVSSDSSGEPRKNRGDANSECVSFGAKRDADSVREKGAKFPKLSVDVQMKENVDPRNTDEFSKGFPLSRRGSQGWAKRRGSAPVGLLSKQDDFTMISISSRTDHNSRRGSVPIEISRHQGGGSNRLALGPRAENLPTRRRASLPQETTLGCLLGNVSSFTVERENYSLNNNNNINNTGSSNNNGIGRIVDSFVLVPGMPSPRRGSVPADISELRRDLFNRTSINGKTRNRKKVLRRRSSGGPEMFSGGSSAIDGNDNGTWLKWKRELGKKDSIPEPVVKRRGSLPIDVVAVSHTGLASGARRSSLWRL